jgi:V/A-type H+-transporting ATPase subunit I
MPFLRPVPMEKLGLVGLKDDQELIVGVVHDLGVAMLEPVDKETLTVYEPERASDLARTVGDQLIRIRSLRTALPPTPVGSPRRFTSLTEVIQGAQAVPIDEEVARYVKEEEAIATEQKSVADQLALLNRYDFYTDHYEYLTGRDVFAFFGEAPPPVYARLHETVPQLGASQFLASVGPKLVRFVVIVRSDQAEAASRLAQQNGVRLTAVPKWTGRRPEVLAMLQEQKAALDLRAAEVKRRLTELSQSWYAVLVALEEALAIENRKLEVYTRFAASERTFAMEVWVPKKDVSALQQGVTEATHGRAYFYAIPTHEEPPTKLANPPAVRWYEFFIRFYAIPEGTEWDPTWIFAIAFTLFFGIMVGDWGYALVILLVCIWMIRGFPGAHRLPKGPKNFVKLIMTPAGMRQLAYTLLLGCLVGIAVGVVFNEFFGFPVLTYIFPSYHGVDLAHSAANVGFLLKLSGYIGVVMISLGFALGAVKEYYHGHPRAAAGKVAAIAFTIGIAWVGLWLLEYKIPGINPVANPIVSVAYVLLAVGLLVMFFGEGVLSGSMGIIEVVSHVLSYTRLIGILLASIILAVVINRIAGGLWDSGAIVFALLGVIILVGGQAFNVILSVFEPGIQGARLIFVEHFSKYYTGGGRAFSVFGSPRTYTQPHFAGAVNPQAPASSGVPSRDGAPG